MTFFTDIGQSRLQLLSASLWFIQTPCFSSFIGRSLTHIISGGELILAASNPGELILLTLVILMQRPSSPTVAERYWPRINLNIVWCVAIFTR